MISSDSSFLAGFAVGVGDGELDCTGRFFTDGPGIVCGVGVGLGFRRPDCAEVVPAKHAKHRKIKKRFFELNNSIYD